jgi:type II secretory pathway pseudopilin PulG
VYGDNQPMRMWSILVPLIGICVAAGQPLARYAARQRDEAAAVSALRRIQEAQERFRTSVGGYATDVESLVTGCSEGRAGLPSTVFDELAGAGYVVQLRAAADAAVEGQDCQGRPTATDYYLTAAPRTAHETADKAFAGRADGQLFFFVDGVPPREQDLAGGLAISVDALDSFKIP